MAPKWDQAERKAVLKQLDRILKSPIFAGGQRQCRFLRYVVESTLDQETDRLNQFAIGLEVFDRNESFDPSTDAIVRVEAGRLRAKLAEYYAEAGQDGDPVLIGLPKGGYAASFKMRSAQVVSEDPSPPARRMAALASVLALALVAILYLGFFRQSGPALGEDPLRTRDGQDAESPEERSKPAIAVLPFENLSADPAQEYFSDGITEDIITDLSLVSGLIVIARHSSFVYKNRNVSIREVGRALGVEYVLEGSVRRAGERLRINAQLIDADEETHLWANRWDRDVEDVFLVQDEVTRMIVQALELKLTDREDRRLGHRGTVSAEAHDLYLRAQEQFYRFDAEGVRRSLDLFSQSLAVDPTYPEALAWKSRALVYAFLSGIHDSKEGTVDLALDLSRQAIQRDPLLPMAHANLGWALRWDKRIEEAVGAVNAAIRLDSNFAEAYLWQSLILSTARRGQDSLSAVRKGMRLNPHYGVTYIFAMGRAHLVLGDLEAALGAFDRGIQRNPDFIPNHVYKLFALERLGRGSELETARKTLGRVKPDYRQSPTHRYYAEELGDLVKGN